MEFEIRDQCQLYGAEAVLGAAAPAKILKAVSLAGRIEAAFASRERATEWAQWAADYPQANELLIWAMRQSNG